jgi:hypothetical protein
MQCAPGEAQNGARLSALRAFATKDGVHFIGFIRRISNSGHEQPTIVVGGFREVLIRTE